MLTPLTLVTAEDGSAPQRAALGPVQDWREREVTSLTVPVSSAAEETQSGEAAR